MTAPADSSILIGQSKDVWYHGDLVLVNSDGLWFMQGHADDVIKVAGHRIGTAEVEQAAASHPAVAEAIAVGRPDELKGEAIVVHIVVKDGYNADSNLTTRSSHESKNR